MDSILLMVSVPLRGCGFKIILPVRSKRRCRTVSVPLRGCGFKIGISLCIRNPIIKVSVPLRGCGFKISVKLRGKPATAYAVSVPLRGCGFKITRLRGRSIRSDGQFPSPCGDVVLKFISSAALHSDLRVSVPLRGCGFKIHDLCSASSLSDMFPSPCGDVVLKYSRKLTLGKRLHRFPSPCGDVVLKSLRLEALLCLVQNGTLRRGCVSPPFCVGDVF